MDSLTLFNTPTGVPLTIFTIIINIFLAFVLSLIIAWVYKATHKGISYSQSFTFTLILIGFLIAVIIMVIGSSLAVAFGAFGALSLIRFRTAIKDSRDIAFILLVVAIGLAVGTSNYSIAVATTIFSIIIVYILTKTNFGSIRRYDYILNFSAESSQFSNDKTRAIFAEFLKYDNLLNVVSRENGRVLDYSFNIKFIKPSELENFIGRLNQIEGISSIDIISAKNDIEY
ncbi:DUF4956 domain-containing protein [Candidatus Falkowbacteria bacterium]|nr:DUF4956 domain-containing protein [Candidatus Falkowbacteria bacterium]